MKNNLWSLGVHSNPKLLWILNYRIFMGQGNLGLELRGKGSMGFINFKTELILPRHVRILGLELRGKGSMGFPNFINELDPRDFIILWDRRKFRIRIEVQGVAPQEMDFL
jgi:hypothetical protein